LNAAHGPPIGSGMGWFGRKRSFDRFRQLLRARVVIARSALPAPIVSYDVSEGKWRLEAAYGYFDDPNQITVPNQFAFDLASVPRPFWWLIAPFELSIAAPLLHDFLYRYQGKPPGSAVDPPRTYSRRETDLLFRTIMTQEGVPAWRRAAAYRAVRWFGAAAWG
jgi:hypothetical protein